MLAHLCSMNYSPFRSVLIPLAIVTGLAATPAFIPGFVSPISEYHALVALTIFSFVFWLHFTVAVIQDITEILDINCFTIKQKSS
jgi:hypothetical protein